MVRTSPNSTPTWWRWACATPARLDPTSDYFSAATATALDNLQANLGITQTGLLALGQAAFLPTAARITTVTATLGASVQPGAAVLQSHLDHAAGHRLSSTPRCRPGAKVGDDVTITLPNNQTTPGTVAAVGTVATSTGSGSGLGIVEWLRGRRLPSRWTSPSTTPSATGNLDQAPVQVAITTGRVHDALIVPVDALLALAGGGYAVETVDARGVHQLVPVYSWDLRRRRRPGAGDRRARRRSARGGARDMSDALPPPIATGSASGDRGQIPPAAARTSRCWSCAR